MLTSRTDTTVGYVGSYIDRTSEKRSSYIGRTSEKKGLERRENVVMQHNNGNQGERVRRRVQRKGNGPSARRSRGKGEAEAGKASWSRKRDDDKSGQNTDNRAWRTRGCAAGITREAEREFKRASRKMGTKV